MAEPEYERILSQLKLALLSDCACKDVLSDAEKEARDAGLSGADIDAALGERSFDVRTAAILDLGCAIRNDDSAALDSAMRRALALGLTAEELDFFTGFVLEFRGLTRL
ncbi:hypothetical protein [Sphingorhabdus sp. SMR4y]|uniref:hypothetical protein n=1 Tax=Sphingorhabdus sp. SMR4y TaxID=2584094 RepID=UPI000B5C3DFA|nr:hypothetical protein [Sphingorhabdus sp. SMR4y]ASK88832.1 hypothetical protein SPHFLASMR4Y_02088 [Sphingorhabdus sp. SMR4y]